MVIEEHFPEGGIKDAVCSALSEEKGLVITGIAVDSVPKSGSPENLLDKYGLSAKKIFEHIVKLSI